MAAYMSQRADSYILTGSDMVDYELLVVPIETTLNTSIMVFDDTWKYRQDTLSKSHPYAMNFDEPSSATNFASRAQYQMSAPGKCESSEWQGKIDRTRDFLIQSQAAMKLRHDRLRDLEAMAYAVDRFVPKEIPKVPQHYPVEVPFGRSPIPGSLHDSDTDGDLLRTMHLIQKLRLKG
jgi:hypothetical protein